MIPVFGKRLYLMRHAKSDWNDPDQADFDRPLNARGLQTTPLMGAYFREKGFHPDVLIFSPARRARQTAELFVRRLERPPAVQFDEAIYEASPGTLLRIISEISDSYESAFIVGHNPGMEGLIRFLADESVEMPTAAIAVLDLRIKKWSEINGLCGAIRNVFRPKEIFTDI